MPSGVVTDRNLYTETICGLMDYYGEKELARILNVTSSISTVVFRQPSSAV
jgi:hypothetical protein